MTTEDLGKEPGNWELYRGIERVEVALHEIARTALSQAVFAVEKQALHQRIDLHSEDLIELKAAQLANETRLKDYAKEQDSQREKNRRFVVALVATPITLAILTWMLNGGLSISSS